MVGPDPSRRGGISSALNELSKTKFWLENGCEMFPSSLACEGGNRKGLLSQASRLARFVYVLAWSRPDVVGLHAASKRSFYRKALYAAACRLFGVPYVWHVHVSHFLGFYEAANPLVRGWVRVTFQQAANVLYLSRELESFFQSSFVHCSGVLAQPISLVEWDHGRNGEDGSRSDVPRASTFLFLARLERDKGIGELLEAFAALHREFPSWKLLVAGGQPSEDLSAEIRSKLPEGSWEFVGWLEGQEKRRALLSAGAMVLPSYSEGFPVSVLEAMKYETPLIVTSVGGIPDYLTNGREALVIPPRDVDALKRAMLDLVTHPSDAKIRARECLALLRSTFDAEVVGKELARIYRQAAK